MDHTFELLNPRDYLRLLHGVYFDGRSIPLERNPARLIKLAIQGVVLVILLNALLVLALTLGGGDRGLGKDGDQHGGRHGGRSLTYPPIFHASVR